MELKLIVSNLGLECSTGEVPETSITGGYTSDLLSDVMGNCKKGSVWITMHTHLNIVAVAALLEIPAIIISGGNIPDPETIARAAKEGVTILLTPLSSFEISGELYKLLTPA